jgi:hypothetical protein
MILFSFIDQNQCFEMGYKDFGYMHSLFGDLVIFFNEDDSVSRLRGLIHSLFIPQTVQTVTDVVNRSCDHHFPSFEQHNSIAIYDHFKQLTTEMCLSLFLGLDCKEEMKKITALTVTHWHGKSKTQCSGTPPHGHLVSIWSPCYYGHLFLSLENAKTMHFLKLTCMLRFVVYDLYSGI